MFNNLIESSSHKSELKRRGSFVLFTMATYALLFVIAGIASVYTYDAHLEDQNLEVVTMFSPVDFPVLKPATPEHESATPRTDNPNRPMVDERRLAMASVNHPEVAPDKISTNANPDLPVRDRVPFSLTGRNRNADLSGAPIGLGRDSSGGITGPTTVEVTTPPPAPEQKPKPAVISKGVITSEALSLPKPLYPLMAKQMHLQGKVSVQVLIDETGKVISARAVDGHPIFCQVAQDAAYRARFSPTKLGDQPVKVSGVITYNFVLQ